jgi:hypothetical protein
MGGREIESILVDVMASLDYDLVSPEAFKARWSTEVEHYLYWRTSRTGVALICEYGLRNTVSELYAQECARLYGGLPGKDLQTAFAYHSCCMRFTLARLSPDVKQILMIFSGLTETEFRGQIASVVHGRILSALASVVSLAALREVLAQDQQKCPWYAANGALLAAKLAKLDRMIGRPPHGTEAALMQHVSEIQQALRADRHAHVYISKILSHEADGII